MLTLMRATAASPDYVLRAGEVYDLPRSLSKQLCAARMPGAAVVKKDKDGKERTEVVWAGPCAEVLARKDVDPKKVRRLPPRPDPEDQVEVDEDGDFEKITEDADEGMDEASEE